MTAYTGFLVLGIIMLREILSLGITTSDVIFYVIILGITSILVFVPEIRFKDQHSPYTYSSRGYYEKFL